MGKDKTKSNGAIPATEFIAGALEAFQNDVLEVAVGMPKDLRQQSEGLFSGLDP